MSTIVFVMGCTCAGKSTFINNVKQYNGIGVVEVGKLLRAKYPPEYFEGSAAPKKTEKESWDMCYEAIQAHTRDPKILKIYVDGQPRSKYQVEKCCELFPHASYLLLDATLETRHARMMQRDTGANLELTQKRLTNDMITYYTVLVELLKRGKTVNILETNK